MAPESGGRGGPGCPSSGLALPPQDLMDDGTALPTPWPLSDSAYKSLWPLAVVLALGSLRKVPGGEGPRVLGPGMFQVGPPVSSEATSIPGLGCRSRATGLSGLIFCWGGALSRWDAGRKTWCPSLWSLHRLVGTRRVPTGLWALIVGTRRVLQGSAPRKQEVQARCYCVAGCCCVACCRGCGPAKAPGQAGAKWTRRGQITWALPTPGDCSII